MAEDPLSEDSFEGTRMTLGEHLDELRKRLLRGALAVLVAFGFAWYFYEDISITLWQPWSDAVEMINEDRLEAVLEEIAAGETTPEEVFVDPEAEPPELVPERKIAFQLIQTAPGEGFLFALKTSFFLALFGGSPVLIWELWAFVAAGLYPRERKAVTGYFPFSVLLFVGGVLFGYFVMMPYALYYLATVYELPFVENQYKIAEYGTMLFSLCLALGAVFQLPAVMLLLARIGLIDAKKCGRYRGHFAVGAFIIAAILTPPDPFTQAMMALPMILLYELGIWLARWAARKRQIPDLDLPREYQ